jgi:uncharacterized protein with ParB-like and HNH nuclease domain
MSEEKLSLKPITSLLDKRFCIPSYQRGYRWSYTQVNNLLDDIWNFRIESENKGKEAFYCLQPIVVSKKDDEWEVLDGQQRLTTIYLILYFLKEGLTFFGKSNFQIRYETRKDSENFLQNINTVQNSDTIDHYHFVQALLTIEKWFSGKDGSVRINFLTTLLNDDEIGKNVKFIWYDVSDENLSNKYATDIFTRLNVGKIPLTNSELIKALFLSKSWNGFDVESRDLKQINISAEWDRIEQTLQNKDFWYFICNVPDKYDTRIEYIFDLMKEKKDDDENYFTFYQFSKDFEQEKNDSNYIDKIWLTIKEYFLTFEEWYQDQELYHLIGYLIVVGRKVKDLKVTSKGRKKSDFKKWLKDEAKKTIRINELETLNFDDDKKEIRKVLLLFNILSILENPKSNIRFPFYLFRTQNWDIEHIRSQTNKDISGKDRENWAFTHLEYFTGISKDDQKGKTDAAIQNLVDEERLLCAKLLKIVRKEDKNSVIFFDVIETLQDYFKEKDRFDDTDGLSNLALLDEGTNRMYRNAFFPVKRKHIINKEKQGVFIPLCTRNVFLKAYSRKLDEIMYWTNKDANDYLLEIKRLLNHG